MATLRDTAIQFPIELAQAELELWLSDRNAAAADDESLQDDPAAGAFARAWLVQHGYLQVEPGQGGEAALDTMLGVLATLAEIGPDAGRELPQVEVATSVRWCTCQRCCAPGRWRRFRRSRPEA